MIEIAISDLIAIGISGVAMGISIASIAWIIAIRKCKG